MHEVQSFGAGVLHPVQFGAHCAAAEEGESAARARAATARANDARIVQGYRISRGFLSPCGVDHTVSSSSTATLAIAGSGRSPSRHADGATPTRRLNARLNAASEP